MTNNPNQARVGIVIRKDGTVPFDDDVHPDVKRQILGHLSERGHVVEKDEHGNHKIRGWVPGKEV